MIDNRRIAWVEERIGRMVHLRVLANNRVDQSKGISFVYGIVVNIPIKIHISPLKPDGILGDKAAEFGVVHPGAVVEEAGAVVIFASGEAPRAVAKRVSYSRRPR